MASKKLNSFNEQPDEDVEMDMSPMIDMVFLLLIFFIVVSTPMTIPFDQEVKPATAYNSKKADDKNGRILVNVRRDGSVYPVIVESGPLANEDAITKYVKEQVEIVRANGYEPKLLLRADKDAEFVHARNVVKAAAKGGVSNVIFSAYDFEK